MNDYFLGTLFDLKSRTSKLKQKIPPPFKSSVFFSPLHTKADGLIDDCLSEIDNISTWIEESFHEDSSLIIQDIKAIVSRINGIEYHLITAINRQNKDDLYLNKLVNKICEEIRYPIHVPIVSCNSPEYYHIIPDYNLMYVPLMEAESLLHLPDIYHELGHPLIDANNLNVKPFKDNLGRLYRVVRKHFLKKIREEERKTNKTHLYDKYTFWYEAWVSWGIEFFCDLFAVFTLGSAYVWSNLHLSIKQGENPFESYKSHPSDDSRMRITITALEFLGFTEDARLIRLKWNEYLSMADYKNPNDYAFAYPSNLTEACIAFALEGTKLIGCKIVNPDKNEDEIGLLLNDAWATFWKNPSSYNTWETHMVAEKKNRFEL